jgi:hypothetical protein
MAEAKMGGKSGSPVIPGSGGPPSSVSKPPGGTAGDHYHAIIKSKSKNGGKGGMKGGGKCKGSC